MTNSKGFTYSPVAIIIVNWNGEKLLPACLASLKKLTYPKSKLVFILVDNGSTDNSVAYVKKNYSRVIIINLNKNLGFAQANNIGIHQTLENKNIKYLITLNNDVHVSPNWLRTLVSFLNNNNRVGLAMGKILQVPDKQRIYSTGDFFHYRTFRVINRERDKIDRQKKILPEQVLSVCAAAAVYRREMLEDIRINNEFFDNDFVSYLEDVDLSIRARLRNWQCFFVPQAICYHQGSQTVMKQSLGYKDFFSKRNRLLFAWKNFPIKYCAFLFFKYIFPTSLGWQYYMNQNKKVRTDSKISFVRIITIHLQAILGAFWLLPKMYQKRRLIRKRQTINNLEIKSWFTKFVIS